MKSLKVGLTSIVFFLFVSVASANTWLPTKGGMLILTKDVKSVQTTKGKWIRKSTIVLTTNNGQWFQADNKWYQAKSVRKWIVMENGSPVLKPQEVIEPEPEPQPAPEPEPQPEPEPEPQPAPEPEPQPAPDTAWYLLEIEVQPDAGGKVVKPKYVNTTGKLDCGFSF